MMNENLEASTSMVIVNRYYHLQNKSYSNNLIDLNPLSYNIIIIIYLSISIIVDGIIYQEQALHMSSSLIKGKHF